MILISACSEFQFNQIGIEMNLQMIWIQQPLFLIVKDQER